MIDVVLLSLRLWSFGVLPLAGFIIGQLLQFALGTRGNCKYESLVVHIITVALMILVFMDITANSEFVKDFNERAVYFSICYLFILGVALGIISKLF